MSLAADSHGQASLIAGERRQSINTDEDATWMRVLIRCTLMALLVAVVSAVVLAVLTAPINVVGAMQVNTFVIYHAALVNAGLQLLAMIGMSTYLRRRDLQHWWDTADGNAKARGLFFVLLCCQLLLATAFWLTHGRGLAYYGYLRALFGFDDEFNLPALFSSMQLGLASGLAFAGYRVIPRQERMWTWAWPFAGTILLYMAMDELLTIHEHVGYLVAAHSWSQDGTRGIIEIGNWRIRPWTLVFFPLALAIGLVLARGFWKVLSTRDFAILIFAGGLFLGGSIGIENLHAHLVTIGVIKQGEVIARVSLLAEETAEMFSVALVVWIFARTVLTFRQPNRRT